MENIEQINDIKEKLNNLTSTFNECTIHEEIERGHVPSQESVKVSGKRKNKLILIYGKEFIDSL